VEALEDRRVPAAITLTQNIGVAAAQGNHLDIPITQAVAAGHRVIVEFAAQANGTPTLSTPTIADSVGNHYTIDAMVEYPLGDGMHQTVIASALVTSPIPAGQSILVSGDNSLMAAAVSAQEFYGLDAIEAPSRPDGNFETGPAARIFTGYEVTQAPALVIGAFSIDAIADGVSFDSPATALSGIGTGGPGAAVQLAPAYLVATTLATPTSEIQGSLTNAATWLSAGVSYPGDPTTHFEVDVAPTAGEVLSVTVKALDGSGNVDPGYTGTVHLTSPDAGAILPADTTFTPTDAGVKTFQVTLPDVGSQTITATDTVDTAIVGSDTVNVTPGPMTHFGVSAPAGTAAGSQFSFAVTALDAFGNVASGYKGTVQFTSSDGQATLPPNCTFTTGTGGDNGVHTFTGVTLRTAGSQTISVADATTTSDKGSTTVAVSPGAAAVFLISAPSTATAGVAFNLTVTVQDAYGNIVPTFTGTVTFSSADRKVILPPNYTFTAGTGGDNGVHTFSVTLENPSGLQSITVSEMGDPLLSAVVEILVSKGGKKK
jgi:hypothetical protein